jgi:hypothetical protein
MRRTALAALVLALLAASCSDDAEAGGVILDA